VRKAAIRRLFDEAFDKGNLEVVDEVFAEDFVYHLPPVADIEGVEGYKNYVEGHYSGYSDIQFTIDDLVVEGDISAMRWTFRGKQTGHSPTLGVGPTGKDISFTGCTVFHYGGDKVVEMWTYADYVGLMTELGFQIAPPSNEE
jgi:predicted ester cyclase